MHCTLLVPDLLWPRATAEDAARGLSAPALETALARARMECHPAVPVEAWLCQAFEVERQQDWPVAPLTLALDGGEPGDGYWLRADPVHLQLQRERVALMGSHTLQVTRDEASRIAAALNAQFEPDGLRFEAPAAGRWYVRAARRPTLVTETVSAAAGRNARDVQPAGEDAPAWRHIANEIQMLLHALPLNDERADAGLPAINSVWIWGGGVKADVPGRIFTAVWSDDALAQALAVHADAHAAALPAGAAAWLDRARALRPPQHHLIVFDRCTQGTAYSDAAAWRDALGELERAWIAPLLAALRKRVLETLVIAAPCAAGSWRFELDARALYKFWARPRPLSRYSA